MSLVCCTLVWMFETGCAQYTVQRACRITNWTCIGRGLYQQVCRYVCRTCRMHMLADFNGIHFNASCHCHIVLLHDCCFVTFVHMYCTSRWISARLCCVYTGFNFTRLDLDNIERQTLTYHRFAEAFKFAYAKRSLLADEDYVNVEEVLAQSSKCAAL